MEAEESKDRILTREGMVRRLKELEYNSLAAALETGTMEKLSPDSGIAYFVCYFH